MACSDSHLDTGTRVSLLLSDVKYRCLRLKLLCEQSINAFGYEHLAGQLRHASIHFIQPASTKWAQ
jgi:hypothetical protein